MLSMQTVALAMTAAIVPSKLNHGRRETNNCKCIE